MTAKNVLIPVRDVEQFNRDLSRLHAILQTSSDALRLHSIADIWHITENLQALADQAFDLQNAVEHWLAKDVQGVTA